MGLEGSIVAIAGLDFALIGTSSQFHDCSHLLELTPKAVLGTIGCFVHIEEQNRLMRSYLENPFNNMLTTDIWRQQITSVIYPLDGMSHAIDNVLVGLDNNGKGCIYMYNRIGDSNAVKYLAIGYAKDKLHAVLETLPGWKKVGVANSGLTKEWAADAVEKMYTSVAADGNLGKFLYIKIVTRMGIAERKVPLRRY